MYFWCLKDRFLIFSHVSIGMGRRKNPLSDLETEIAWSLYDYCNGKLVDAAKELEITKNLTKESVDLLKAMDIEILTS